MHEFSSVLTDFKGGVGFLPCRFFFFISYEKENRFLYRKFYGKPVRLIHQIESAESIIVLSFCLSVI